jgi:hypothetical protein
LHILDLIDFATLKHFPAPWQDGGSWPSLLAFPLFFGCLGFLDVCRSRLFVFVMVVVSSFGLADAA